MFAYGSVGLSLIEFAAEEKKSIAFVGIKKEDPYKDLITDVCTNFGIRIIEVDNINDKKSLLALKKEKIDLGFLLWWPDIVKEDTIKIVKKGFVNLHPSLLPFNRGMHPYYWSIVDKTPAGVSLHFINKEIDAGEIIAQEEIQTDITFTGEKLYHIAAKKIISLSKRNYASILGGKITCTSADTSQGTFHLKKELDDHSEIILQRKYKAGDLLDIIRGRTFTSGPSAFFYKDGKKYNVRVHIEEEVD